MNNENRYKKYLPGPGSYSPRELKKENYRFSFGVKASVDYTSKYKKIVPGPGAYNDDLETKTFSKIGASIGKSSRHMSLNKT